MKLTPIRHDQFPLWQTMRRKIYPILDAEYDKQEMEQVHLSDDWFCYFLSGDDGQIVGLVELSLRNIVDSCLSSPVAYLEGLYLEETQRGIGLGKEAVELVLAWCRDKGLRELATDAELKNESAQGFYKALGFEETDRVVEYRIEVK